MLRTACSALALLALCNPALAITCASPSEATAIKTALIQQELMVAALQCRETGAYNRFVIAYRGELQASDANLKAFFARRGGEHGEAGYDTFKTKAANLSALQQARNTRAFCAGAHDLFLAARNHQGSLMSFVEARSGIDLGNNICVESRPVLSGAQVKPGKAPALVRTADAAIRPAEITVGGVPDHNTPAIPYRLENRDGVAPPPRTGIREGDRENDARGSDATANGQEAPPPPHYGPRNVADGNRGPDVVRTADAKAPPAEVAVGGVPGHNIPAIPYQQEGSYSAAPPPRAVARNDYAAQSEENSARGSYATAEEAPPPRPRYYGPRNRTDYYRDYEERAYREPAYYPRPPTGMPLSRWQQQNWQWQAWREYPRPRYGLYPRDPYRGW